MFSKEAAAIQYMVVQSAFSSSCIMAYFDGGGAKNGIAGIVVGIVGIVGIVGMELVAGNGGRVTLGMVVGNVGLGKDDGIWKLGRGGNAGSFGKAEAGGKVNWGTVVGTSGKGGNETLGRVGIVGEED
ncbi:hypothetical protein U1Q18_011316 [Sarracenia purpurea var. burkii]